MLNGKYIGDIDGAHFKGTYNFGLVVSNALTHTLKDFMLEYSEQKEDAKLMEMFVEQMDSYLLVSVSLKDKLKLWKFERGLSTPVSQANALGGSMDSEIHLVYTLDKQICLMVMGSASNKIELFKLKPHSKEKENKPLNH